MLLINRPFESYEGRLNHWGRRLNEDTYTVQIVDEHEQLVSIAKSETRSIDVETRSPMPAYADRLTADEIADLVAYLLTLREH